MFDKNKFSKIIKNIKETYNSQEEFAKMSGIGRTYLSQYMNMKLDKPPKPEILEKLANASHGITDYDELMQTCGYIFLNELTKNSFGINPTHWTMIFGNTDKVNLTTKGSTFLASLFDKGMQEAEKAAKAGKKTFVIDFNPDLLIPFTNDVDEIIEYTKIFCFFICSIVSTMSISDLEKKQLLDNVEELLSNIPEKSEVSNVYSQYYLCPVYGKISAGEPNWAEECLDGYLPIDPNLMNIVNPEECFFLKINGESMNKIIKDGAYALIRKTDFVENGEIAVVLVNGFDATLKKFTKQGDVIVLEPMSDDPTITTQVYNKDTTIKVIGKYIGKMEMNN